jgi:hypothetical protein
MAAAHYREECYAALELARPRPHRALLPLALLPVFEETIRDGAWWDYYDNLAGNEITTLLMQQPRQMKPRLRRWAKCDCLWLRRAAIPCQRGRREDFDVKLFYDGIAPSIRSGRCADNFYPQGHRVGVARVLVCGVRQGARQLLCQTGATCAADSARGAEGHRAARPNLSSAAAARRALAICLKAADVHGQGISLALQPDKQGSSLLRRREARVAPTSLALRR